MYLTGRVPALVLLGLLPVVLRPGTSTVWVWVGVVCLAVALDVALAPAPAALGVSRLAVPGVRAGEDTLSVLEVHNPLRRRVRLRLRDAWQPSAGAGVDRHQLVVPAGGTRSATTALAPRRRGMLRAQGVSVRTAGPLRLAGRQRTLAVPGQFRALPAFPSRKHLASRLAQLRELDGRSAVRVRGQGTEFDSLREYVRGDDVRSIDWRASARSRHVVVRTWQPERDRRIVIVLDTSRTSAARVGDVPRLDAAMDATLLLSALAGRAGDRVDFIAGDRLVRAALREAGRHASAGIQELLADVEPELAEADWRMLAGAVQAQGRHRALVVLLTSLEPAPVLQGLLPVLPTLLRHHRVVLASVADPELDLLAERFVETGGVADVHAAAAAGRAIGERAHLAELLRSLGVDVIERPPDELGAAVADHYLALKARGLL